MNLPNALTVLRLALIPVFAGLYLHDCQIAALAVYVAAAFTDALDGYLARRMNQITAFGKLCDPLADKLMQLTMLFCLAGSRLVPWWLLAALLVREGYQVAGAVYLLRRRKVVVSAKLPGKIATCLLIGGILCVYPWHRLPWLVDAGRALLMGGLAFAMISSVCYTVSAVRQVRGQETNR